MASSGPAGSLRVFLCHASGDKERVRALYDRLRADGFAPWLDEEDLQPGQRWRDAIPKAVRAADIVLVCLSKRSVEKTGFVQKEIAIALDAAEERPEGAIYIIPARLEECAVPGRLSDFQRVDLFGADGYERLLRSLRVRARALAPEELQSSPAAPLVAPAAPPGRIAYIGRDKQLHVLDIAGGGDAVFPIAGRPYSPRWSPDGRKVVYGEELSTSPCKAQIAVLDPATGRSEILVRPEVRFGDPLHPPIQYFHYDCMCWTPSGDAVVYKKASGARMHNAYMRVPASGGQPQDLQGADTNFLISTSDFDISPADGRMAIVDNGLDQNAGSGQLAVADLDGRNRRIVRPFGGTYYAAPVWTADGREIAVLQGVGQPVTWVLTLIDPDTYTQRVLGSVFRGSTYAFAPHGNWMVLADAATEELLLIDLTNFAERRPIGHGFLPAWGPEGGDE